MEYRILEISARENVFISQNGIPVNPNKPIWQSAGADTGGKEIRRPAAFLVKKGGPARLEVTVKIPAAKPGEEYILNGIYNNTVLFGGGVAVPGEQDKKAIFYVSIASAPAGFLSIVGENISWRLTQKDSRKSGETAAVFLELYWIFGTNYSVFKRGVPIEALRELSGALPPDIRVQPDPFDAPKKVIDRDRLTPGVPAYSWTIKEVVDWCFKRNPPRYDIWRGANAYTVINSWDNITLLLGKYLRAIMNPNLICNCYDMAAVVQYYLGVIGITDVKYCFMQPFGYLKKTDLIGRGICNNPFYGATMGEPVVPETDRFRTAFGNHAFCFLEGDGRIVDACAGPHTGSENTGQYVNAAVDSVYYNPPNVRQGTVNDIRYYRGVTKTVNLSSVAQRPELPLTQPFADEVGAVAQARDGKPEQGVVCAWPDPRQCPELQKDNWEMFFQDIIPGPQEVMKTWSLKKDNQSVEINLYVSSKGNHLAINRFLSIGSLSSLPELPYKKGTRELGAYSAESVIAGNNRYFWVFHNIVFDVHCHHVTFDIDSLLKWLNDLAAANTKKDIAVDLPAVENITCTKTNPKTGEDISVSAKTPVHIKSDFEVDGDGLRLTDETDESLLFTAMGKSENLLTLFNVNKETLLTNSKDFRVSVS